MLFDSFMVCSRGKRSFKVCGDPHFNFNELSRADIVSKACNALVCSISMDLILSSSFSAVKWRLLN